MPKRSFTNPGDKVHLLTYRGAEPTVAKHIELACDCGKTYVVDRWSWKLGRTYSCGCAARARKPFIRRRSKKDFWPAKDDKSAAARLRRIDSRERLLSGRRKAYQPALRDWSARLKALGFPEALTRPISLLGATLGRFTLLSPRCLPRPHQRLRSMLGGKGPPKTLSYGRMTPRMKAEEARLLRDSFALAGGVRAPWVARCDCGGLFLVDFRNERWFLPIEEGCPECARFAAEKDRWGTWENFMQARAECLRTWDGNFRTAWTRRQVTRLSDAELLPPQYRQRFKLRWKFLAREWDGKELRLFLASRALGGRAMVLKSREGTVLQMCRLIENTGDNPCPADIQECPTTQNESEPPEPRPSESCSATNPNT